MVSPFTRPVYWVEDGRWVETRVARVADVAPDGRLDGPGLIELRDTVVVVRPGQSASFDELGNIVLDLRHAPDPTRRS